jgi:peptidoglycan/xylan/chitin deacetylase (PgdA/CDA1 family)
MGLILLYHRVCRLVSDPQRLAVDPDRFAQHLDALAGHFEPMPLSELVERAQLGTMPKRAVAITFDDGYADNLEFAKPVLERRGVPATVFVATGYVDGGQEFWWDDLERLLLTPGRLPSLLRLKTGGELREWDLGKAAAYDGETSRRHSGWNVESATDPTERHRLYRQLCGILRALTRDEREAVLSQIAEAAEGTVAARSTHRVLAPEEIARLTEGGIVDVGAHSVSHPALAALSLAAQHDEIAHSKARVEELAGCPVSAFAYPFGTSSDYTSATIDLVRGAGFSSACLATPGRLGRRSNRYRLPRLTVRDWNADTFADHVRAWV